MRRGYTSRYEAPYWVDEKLFRSDIRTDPDRAIVNGTGAAESGYTTSAAIVPGEIASLYGTGFGPTNSPYATGVVFSGGYPTANTVTVTIGGVPAEVLWAGLAGAGLYQINVKVPASLPDGDQAVIAFVGGLASQAGALLKVAASARLSASVLNGAERGPFRALLRGPADVSELLVLAGLTLQGPQSEGGGIMARIRLQALERQGGIVQLV